MTLRQKFREKQSEHTEFSSIVNFSIAVEESETTRKEVLEEFDNLVAKRDYLKSDREDLLHYLFELICTK